MNKNQVYDGYLITFEGIDMAGKTTVLNRLKQSLKAVFEEHGVERNIVFTNEPNDHTSYGQAVRDSLESDDTTHPLALFHGFLADHYQHLYETVIPALRRGDVVICDRYIDSRYVYQPPAIGEFVHGPYEWVRSVQEKPNYTPEPDMTIFIDISVDESLDRLGDIKGDTFEKHESLEHARNGYMDLHDEFDRITRVDGEMSKNTVYNMCEHLITSFVSDGVHEEPKNIANVLAYSVSEGDTIVCDLGNSEKKRMYVKSATNSMGVDGFGERTLFVDDENAHTYEISCMVKPEYQGGVEGVVSITNGDENISIERLYVID